MRSTINGSLVKIPDCFIQIPGTESIQPEGKILLNNLPDISDTKQAVYNGENIIGRSFPLYTYSHSADRNISIVIHLFVVDPGDGKKNLQYLRMIQSAVYPRNGSSSNTPYQPPPLCKIACGPLLDDEPLCAVLQSYSVKFPTEVAWEEETYCPYRFDIETQWSVVYSTDRLPFQEDIINDVIRSRIFDPGGN